MKLTKAARELRKANTERARETLWEAKRRILRRLLKEGLVTEEQAKEEYVALEVMLRLIYDPESPPVLKGMIAKELLPHEFLTLAEKAKVDAIGEGGERPIINVVVQLGGLEAGARGAARARARSLD